MNMPSALIASLLVGLSFSSLSYAEDAKKEKRQERRRLKLKDMSKEDLAKEFREAAHKKNLELITMYEGHLKDPNYEGEQKAMLMFRLAEKYFEEGRYYYYQEMQAYETKYDKCFNTPGCDVNKMNPNNSGSQKWQKKSIRLYRNILDYYPGYTRADQVLFFLGSALQEIKDTKQAVKQFQRLTKEYSSSKYLPDAYVNIGEYYFDNNKAYPALNAYKQATKYRNSPRFGFAKYKLAWCYYNVGEYGEAITNMKGVVSYSMAGVKQGDKKKVTLQEEALKDLVRFFADAGKMDAAYEYFTALGKKNLVIKMLKRLAKMYFSQGKFEQSINTYRRLIAEQKTSPSAPSYQNEIIQAFEKMGRKKETLNEVKKLLKEYGKNSAWARSNSSNPDAIKKALRYVENNLNDLAADYHSEARKLGAGPDAFQTFKHAETAYRAYLKEFPQGKYVYDMRFMFGELVYELAEYYNKKRSADPDRSKTKQYFTEAFEQYSKVVEMNPKGKNSQDSAENAMFAAREMVLQEKNEGKIKKRKSRTDTEIIELSKWEDELLRAFDNYAKVFPKSKKTKNFLYESAELLFAKNRLDEASQRYRRVIKLDPRSKLALKAASGIVEALAFRAGSKEEKKDYPQAVKDYKSLRDTAAAFRDQKGLGAGAFKTKMADYYQVAFGKLVEVTYEGSGKTAQDKKTAASGYLQYQKNFPKAKKADAALNLAAVYFYQTNMLRQSIKTRHQLIEQYPKSKYYMESIKLLGSNYETIASFEKASTWFEKLYELDKNYKEKDINISKEAIYRASLFRENLGDWKKALANKQEFMKTYPDDDRTAGIPIDIARMYKKNGEKSSAANAFKRYYESPPSKASFENVFFARVQHGLLLSEMGKTKDSKKSFNATIAAYDKHKAAGKPESPLVNAFVGQIKFILAGTAAQKYYSLDIGAPRGRCGQDCSKRHLNKKITTKQSSLKENQQRYQEVFGLKAGQWSLASIVEIGKLYENYAKSIENSWTPDYLTEGAKEMYAMQLEDQSFPIKQKSIQYYKTALKIAYQENLYTDATAYATRRLGKLQPAEYPPLDEELLKPTYLSTKTKTRTFIKKVK